MLFLLMAKFFEKLLFLLLVPQSVNLLYATPFHSVLIAVFYLHNTKRL